MGRGDAARARSVTRRTVVGGVLALGSAPLAACDVSPLDRRPGATQRRSPGTPTVTPRPAEDPDVEADLEVVSRALGTSRGATETLRAVAERFPVLAPSVAPLLAVHRAHTRVLAEVDEEPGRVAPSTRVPRRRAAAIDLVRRTEERAVREYLALAVRARSGPLARVLASMSAGVAQQVALLEPGPRR